MNDTWVTIRGRMTADPTIRTTGGGVPVASFSVATNPRRQVPGQPGSYEDGPTSFYRVSAWRSLGVNAAASLRKGEPVTVYGRQLVRDYPRSDGTTGTRVEVDADAIGHDLRWGTTRYTRNGAGSGSHDASPEPAGQPWDLTDPGPVDYVIDDAAGAGPLEQGEPSPPYTGPLLPVGSGTVADPGTSAA